MDVLRYQECADAWIRLRAEYLWAMHFPDRIAFHLTDGTLSAWSRWANGYRPHVHDHKITESRTAKPDASRTAFKAFLHHVMTYAGTLSLARDLPRSDLSALAAGDLLVQGGRPGHAVVILDLAVDAVGRRVMLVGQSYMPAQEFHVLKNLSDPNLSPWYLVDDLAGDGVHTPDWLPFVAQDLRGFAPP